MTVNLATGSATGDGTDTLTSIENVTGSAQADTSTGNNVLYGGAGADSLTGGSGADTLLFKAATALSASDTIADFNTLQNDKLDVSDILQGLYDPLQDAINDFVQITTSGGNSQLKVISTEPARRIRGRKSRASPA